MRKIFPLIGLIFIFSCQSADNNKAESSETTAPSEVKVENQSETDKNLEHILTAYYGLKDALVEWDTVAVNSAAKNLAAVVDPVISDSTVAEPLRKSLGNISAENAGLLGETDITEKRRAFSMISDNLIALLKESRYKGSPVYHQTCPMAFNDTETAHWLSNSDKVVNPYLGKKHPKYASGMLHCGEVTDTIMFR